MAEPSQKVTVELEREQVAALDRGLFELETQDSPDTITWKSTRAKLRTALSEDQPEANNRRWKIWGEFLPGPVSCTRTRLEGPDLQDGEVVDLMPVPLELLNATIPAIRKQERERLEAEIPMGDQVKRFDLSPKVAEPWPLPLVRRGAKGPRGGRSWWEELPEGESADGMRSLGYEVVEVIPISALLSDEAVEAAAEALIRDTRGDPAGSKRPVGPQAIEGGAPKVRAALQAAIEQVGGQNG